MVPTVYRTALYGRYTLILVGDNILITRQLFNYLALGGGLHAWNSPGALVRIVER